MVNLAWNTWCDIAGADPTVFAEKKAFNLDTRVAQLSNCDVDLIQDIGARLWATAPRPWHAFITEWLDEVAHAQEVRDEEREARRRAHVEAAARRKQAVEAATRIRKERQEEERRHEELAAAQRVAAFLEAQRRQHEAETALLRRRAACNRQAIPALYNIVAIENLASILRHGLLSHERAARIAHVDLSDAGVQARRAYDLPNGRPLHSFANLYFNPRNAMLFRLRREARSIVVLRIRAEVLDLDGTWVSSGNAARHDTGRYAMPEGLGHIDLRDTYASEWTVPDETESSNLRRVTQAELLVPDRVPPQYVEGFLVPDALTYAEVARMVPWPGRVDPHLFFSSDRAPSESG